MIKELAINATNKCDFFVAKKGISDKFSPETIVTGRQLDHKKHCLHELVSTHKPMRTKTPETM